MSKGEKYHLLYTWRSCGAFQPRKVSGALALMNYESRGLPVCAECVEQGRAYLVRMALLFDGTV